MAYRLYNNDNGEVLGEITEAELSSLTSLNSYISQQITNWNKSTN